MTSSKKNIKFPITIVPGPHVMMHRIFLLPHTVERTRLESHHIKIPIIYTISVFQTWCCQSAWYATVIINRAISSKIRSPYIVPHCMLPQHESRYAQKIWQIAFVYPHFLDTGWYCNGTQYKSRIIYLSDKWSNGYS